MFWQAPASRGVLRTIPFRMGGRQVQMGGGIFMGQVSANRLDAVSIPAIIGRIQLDPVIQAYLANLNKPALNGAQLGLAWGNQHAPIPAPNFPPVTPAEAQILFEVSKNPTDEELKDLATIDNLFSENFYGNTTTTNEVCYYAKHGYPKKPRFQQDAPVTGESALVGHFHPPGAQQLGFGVPHPQQPQAPDAPFLKDKFWCPDPDNMGPSIYRSYMPLFGPSSTFAGMFGIDVNKTWGEEKLATENGLTMLGVKASYPLPPPLDMSPDYVWSLAAGPHIVEMANIGGKIDPEVFRMWYTMAVLESYDAAATHIVEVQKKKAKKAKRKAIIKAVAFVIAGIVLSFIVPGIIAAAISAIKSAIDMYIAAKERAAAAKAMAEAAKMFEADAPAYAAELQKTADMMDFSAAQEAANEPLTPEQIAAIREVKDNPEPGTTPSTGSMVVGGIAATGIVATLIALLK